MQFQDSQHAVYVRTDIQNLTKSYKKVKLTMTTIKDKLGDEFPAIRGRGIIPAEQRQRIHERAKEIWGTPVIECN